MAKSDKPGQVQEIVSRFSEADAALLTEYRGLTVGQIAELRGALRAADAEYKVLKNTLARIAVREVGLEELAAQLTGPTAIAFIKGDAAAAAKALDEATRKFPVLVVKGGVLNGTIIGEVQAKELAGLEPRPVQLAKIAMMMNSPVQQSANVFSALLRDLGSMLAQVVATKETEAPADAPPPAETPPEQAETPPSAPSTTQAQQEQTKTGSAGDSPGGNDPTGDQDAISAPDGNDSQEEK